VDVGLLHDPRPAPPLWRPAKPLARIGFGVEYSHGRQEVARDSYANWSITFPLWLPAILFSAIPAARLYRRARRFGPAFCATCGYDLRGTPERCPECGLTRGVR
jgi:hypothetical protein